jgi:hypothetical protein
MAANPELVEPEIVDQNDDEIRLLPACHVDFPQSAPRTETP